MLRQQMLRQQMSGFGKKRQSAGDRETADSNYTNARYVNDVDALL